jgi:hypothetical protein
VNRKIFFLTAVMCLNLASVQAQIIVIDSGTCGTNLTWKLTSDSVLTINGSGVMVNYTLSNSAPWYSYRDTIVTAVIGDSVTNIGNSITSIGDYAFISCRSLTAINVDVNNIRYSSNDEILYSKLQDTLVCCPGGKTGTIIILNSVIDIGNAAFYSCSTLTPLSIPNSVTNIGEGAFGSCISLISVNIPDSVTTIKSNILKNKF